MKYLLSTAVATAILWTASRSVPAYHLPDRCYPGDRTEFNGERYACEGGRWRVAP